jgi:hypothetical protein
MNWTALLPIIAQYGIPYAFEIWKILQRHDKPTAEAWQELLALSQKPMSSYIDDARQQQIKLNI